MNGKENIINKILSDADETCSKIIAEAESQAAQTVQAARESAKREREESDARIEQTVAERRRNALANAELAAKRYLLEAKQRLVALCYDKAYNALVSMNAQDRLDLIGELLTKYAEDGETVYITQSDAQTVTEQWLRGFEKHLRLGNRYIRADGGVVLEGAGYEKDLTFASVMRYVKEQTEAVVATKLGVRNEQ